MKNSIKVLVVILTGIYSLGVMAQPVTGGIYLTVQDFKAHKLSYVLSENDKLQLNEFLNGKHINLTYQGKKVKLTKSDVFGYRLYNQDYRFFKNEAYNIVDTAGFMLYSCDKLTQQVKGYKPVTHYFYSTNSVQPTQDLTIANLSNSFPGQAGFRYSLQSYFSRDTDLMDYDKLAGQYKIKYLFFQQKQVLAAHQTTPGN